MSTYNWNPTCKRKVDGSWEKYNRKKIDDLKEFSGWDFMAQLITECAYTPYYPEGPPTIDAEQLEVMRQNLRFRDQSLISTSLLVGGRISEVLMMTAENFTIERDYIEVKNAPLLKRYDKVDEDIVVRKKRLPKDHPYYKLYHWSTLEWKDDEGNKHVGGWVKRTWKTEARVEERDPFPIPLWEPFTNILIARVQWARERQKRLMVKKNIGAHPEWKYPFLFPTNSKTSKVESPGVQKWIEDDKKFRLQSRAWLSPDRAYQIVRSVGHRLGERITANIEDSYERKRAMDHYHVWDHRFRTERASQLGSEYKYNEMELNRFFSWESAWSGKHKTMAQRYAHLGFKDLWDPMIAHKDEVIEKTKGLNVYVVKPP